MFEENLSRTDRGQMTEVNNSTTKDTLYFKILYTSNVPSKFNVTVTK